MPTKAPHPCNYPGCGRLATERFCDKHKQIDRVRVERARGSAAKRGYGHRWRKYRARFLVEQPLCRYCQAEGLLTAATVVDHITPHKGDQRLFWNPDNHQPLCKPCHDSKTAREDGGFGRG